MKNTITAILKKNPAAYRSFLSYKNRELNSRSQSLTYKPEDLNKDYYRKIKDLKSSELEHQIGRLMNMKNIVKECRAISGDFIEFGTWRGFSMLWIAYFMERNAIFDKKFIGLDGFVGLPYSDGVFEQYGFSDTSLEECRKVIRASNEIYEETKNNIIIEKFLYKQKTEILNFLKYANTKKFCFIHIDCDVSQSYLEIFDLLTEGKLIADKCYILFDDYGCDSNLKTEIDKSFKRLSKKWEITVHSSTKLTKNFYFEKK
jgi:hypothetical protein